MFSIFLDGFTIVFEYKLEIFFLLLGIWAGGTSIIKAGLFDDTEEIIKYTAALCTGFLILIGITFTISYLSLFSQTLFRLGCYLVLLASAIILVYNSVTNKSEPLNFRYIIGATLLFLLLLALRLPYLEKITLPSYTDSPIHYQIIRNIIFPAEEPLLKLTIGNIFKNYYHFGYHGVTAWISVVSDMSIARNMSFIGQFSLALIPLSVAFVTYTLTRTKVGALYAGLLSTFGWVMPAFAVNWGKFPALLAIATISIAIGLLTLIINKRSSSYTHLPWIVCITLCTVIIHTRVIILVILLGIVFFLINTINMPSQTELPRSILYSALFIISLLPLAENLITYFNNPTIGIILLLFLPFAFQKQLRLSTGIFIFVAGLWITSLFFSTLLPNRLQLLDEQFINISLFIPFSVLGGIGVAVGIKEAPQIFKFPFLFVLFLVTYYNSPWQASLTPDPCCILYNQDDDKAFQWIINNTKEDDLFIISTLNDKQQHGVDAGVWIYVLTGRNTNKRLYNTKWSSNEGFPDSCNLDIKDIYIYSGGKLHGFSAKHLSNVDWVEKVFTYGDVNIYKVINCST